MRAFVELTGALSENQSRVFLETGRATNDVYREAWMGEDLGDQNLDGDFNVDALLDLSWQKAREL